MRQTRIRPWLVVACAVPLVSIVLMAADQQEPYSPGEGQKTYKTFCMSCHGDDAKGDGYMADRLKVPPTDLTQLAVQNGGEFPAEHLTRVIDGRAEVSEHGRYDMPVWGDVFLWPEKGTPARQEYVRRKIGELVEYLRTIQAPAPDS